MYTEGLGLKAEKQCQTKNHIRDWALVAILVIMMALLIGPTVLKKGYLTSRTVYRARR